MKRTRRRDDDDDDDDDDDAQSSSAATSTSASTSASIDLQQCLTGDQNVAMADLAARAAALSIDTGNKSRERLCYEVAVNEWERGGDADNATWRQRWAAVRNHMDVLERLGVLQQGALCKYGDFIEDPAERAAAIRDGKLPILDLLQEPIAPDDVVTLNNRCMSRKFLFEWFRSGQDRTTNPRNPYTKEEMSRQDVAATGFDPMRLRAFNENASEYRKEEIMKLINALQSGRRDEVQRIVRSGIDLNFNQVLPDGIQVPLMFSVLSAVQPLQVDMLQLLIDAGASMDTVMLPNQTTLTHFAAKMHPNEIVKMLVENGAPIDTEDITGRTPLMVAVERKNTNVIDTLIDAGANVRTFNTVAATVNSAPELFPYMISKGLDVNARGLKKWTMLHKAANERKRESVVHLLEAGADVNAQQARSNITPLHLAAFRGDVEIVNLLLDAGADPTLRLAELDGRTAEDVANEKQYTLAAQVLRNYRTS